jgi:hypothetical protein
VLWHKTISSVCPSGAGLWLMLRSDSTQKTKGPNRARLFRVARVQPLRSPFALEVVAVVKNVVV